MTDQKDTTGKQTALESRTVTDDARMLSPSAARNKDPILDVLRPHLISGMHILEIASGTGEHGAHIMANIPGLIWQPGDLSEDARKSIAAWVKFSGDENFLDPIALDASTDEWPIDRAARFDGVLCLNMIHIAPLEAAKGVVRGAGRVLNQGGFLYFYGPFKRGGRHTAPSNEAFDENLRSRDPAWGIRDVEEIETLANQAGLLLESTSDMPANNLSLLFRR